MQINNSVNTKSNILYRNEKRTNTLNSSFDLQTSHSSNETASWTHEELMKLFKDLPKNIDYFDKRFWDGRM